MNKVAYFAIYNLVILSAIIVQILTNFAKLAPLISTIILFCSNFIFWLSETKFFKFNFLRPNKLSVIQLTEINELVSKKEFGLSLVKLLQYSYDLSEKDVKKISSDRKLTDKLINKILRNIK